MAYIGKSPTGSAVRSRYYYTATGGETSLSGADDNGKTLKFTDGEYVDVHLNGVMLVQGTDYGVGTANTISSLSALAANDIVEIIVYDVYNVAKINSEAMRNRYYFTATGGETSITTSEVAGLSFNANAELEVRLNGVSLQQGVDFNTTTANEVGGLAALTAGQVVEIIHYADFQLADTVSKAAGGTYNGQVIADGGIDLNGKELILDADGDTSITADTDDQIDFKTGGSDRATIDASGNLLVGKSSAGIAGAGTAILATGTHNVTVDGDTTLQLNRLTSDGNIAVFYQDGTTVGSIATRNGEAISISSGSVGIEFNPSNQVNPSNGSSGLDNTLDLGAAGTRWDDIYATNSTIQTSDQNEKQQIASLTANEITAAKAISKLFKTFKWNDSVTENGDNARTHTGVIAQQVETAMTDAGLDAGDYAFFISSDWYVDADGNEVEADAVGAIAKNRKGIRYPELLSFIGAATEQRLADIETRLTTLENA